jgi:hypothetical protein
MLDPPAARSRRSEGTLQAHREKKGSGGWAPPSRRGIRTVGIPDSAIIEAQAHRAASEAVARLVEGAGS